MLSLIGIIVSIVLIMALAFKNVPLYVYAPLCALVAAVMGGISPYTALAESFVPGIGTYVSNSFLLFVSSAVFASFMGDSGAAKYIAIKISGLSRKSKNPKFAGLMYMALIQIVLTAGGINIFVVFFLLVSLNKTMFKELDIPWNLFLANMWASGTLTIWALPGMPSIQNLIPCEYLGTDAMAGAGLGIFMAVEITVLCVGYVYRCLKKAEKNKEHFLPQGQAIMERESDVDMEIPKGMNMFKALLPSVIVLITLNILKWQPAIALFSGCAVAYILFFKNFKSVAKTTGTGIQNGLSVLLPVAFMAGYGSVIATTEGFGVAIDALTNMPGSEAMQVFVASNIASCICGSVSGGLGIVFSALTDHFLSMNLSPEIIHRIALAGASGLDTMPHAASVHSGMQVAAIKFSWESYKHPFMCNLVFTVITGLTGVLLVDLGIFS